MPRKRYSGIERRQIGGSKLKSNIFERGKDKRTVIRRDRRVRKRIRNFVETWVEKEGEGGKLFYSVRHHVQFPLTKYERDYAKARGEYPRRSEQSRWVNFPTRKAALAEHKRILEGIIPRPKKYKKKVRRN